MKKKKLDKIAQYVLDNADRLNKEREVKRSKTNHIHNSNSFDSGQFNGYPNSEIIHKSKAASEEMSKFIDMLLEYTENYHLNIRDNSITFSTSIEVDKNKLSKSNKLANSLASPPDSCMYVNIQLVKGFGFSIEINSNYMVFSDKKIYNKYLDKFIQCQQNKLASDLKKAINKLVDVSPLKRASSLDELIGSDKRDVITK